MSGEMIRTGAYVQSANNVMICTGIYLKKGNKTFYLDDPKQRQQYVKYMSPRQKVNFAKSYIRSVLSAKEKLQWFTRMVMK
jgi:hypothetical protein